MRTERELDACAGLEGLGLLCSLPFCEVMLSSPSYFMFAPSQSSREGEAHAKTSVPGWVRSGHAKSSAVAHLISSHLVTRKGEISSPFRKSSPSLFSLPVSKTRIVEIMSLVFFLLLCGCFCFRRIS